MKLTDILKEMPILKDTELDVVYKGYKFISAQALKDRWDVIERGRLSGGGEFCVALKKTAEKSAIIGIPGQRADDGADGITVYGYVDFKKPNLSGLTEVDSKGNILQVALVHLDEQRRAEGWGLQLYASLATKYAIISDNTQYIGGKELWKRIARSTLNGKYKVYVIGNGHVRLDDDGLPLAYNGSNIDDSDLWAADRSKTYTLFVLVAQ